MNLYSVHDTKAETFMPPFCVPTKGLAIRAFEDCINSKDHHFGQHPADYTLFLVGTFDTDTGQVAPSKHSIGNGVEFLKLELANTPEGLTDEPSISPIRPEQNSNHS